MSESIFTENIDKMYANTERADDFKKSNTEPEYHFHSRATQMKSRVEKQNRNLWLNLLCFIPTCGFCCGLCLPKE